MSISINKITSFANSAFTTTGKAISNFAEKHMKGVSKTCDIVEFTGGNYSFATMATMMVVVVLIKRIATALTRNPDDKKATMDEIKEICFRDIQTILIMLFLLNALNSMLAGKQTKKDGLPLTDVPFNKVFDSQEKGLKGLIQKTGEFVQHPIEKSKAIIINIIKAFNPLGGVNALTNDEIKARYSGFGSIDEVKKMFAAMNGNGGDGEKVYKNVIDSFITRIRETQKEILQAAINTGAIDSSEKITNPELLEKFEGSKKVLEGLEVLKSKSFEEGLSLLSGAEDDSIKAKDSIVKLILDNFNFDESGKCDFVDSAKNLNAKLRTGALVFEAGYLGFGLPALNKMRLKKEYLDTPQAQTQTRPTQAQAATSVFTNNSPYPASIIINKQLSFQEAQLYKNFLR